MEYKGDYRFDNFLEQGGASDDLAVAEFVIQDVFHGLLSIDLRGGTFGCSTISARTPEGEAVFGRNFWLLIEKVFTAVLQYIKLEIISTAVD